MLQVIRNLMMVTLFLSSLSAMAQVAFVEKGQNGEDDLVFLKDGRVLFVRNSNLFTKEMKFDLPKVLEEPTVLENIRDADKIFGRMRRDYQHESQCFNRAHIWAYEEFKRTSLKSRKMFIFFTSRYIRNYRFGWWFHVAPMVYAKDDAGIPWRMMLDRKYSRGPLTIRQWTDIFMRNNRKCKEVQTFNQYRRNQNSEHCYIIESSMYTWQPRDIRLQKEKIKFYRSEIRAALVEAFKRRRTL